MDIAVALLTLPFAAAAAYLGTLGALALLPPRRRKRHALPRATRFAVVVPAHNEEGVLPRLLASLRAASREIDRIDVHVIADNCVDKTAAVARANGAVIWERFDDMRRSKGYALAWLLDNPAFWANDFDAVVIIDADCVVNEGFFNALERQLSDGARVIQARYDILNPARSATLELRQFAFGLVHVVRARGKTRYGASVGLKGTGMCFSRAVLQEVPWRSFGLAEDAEQHIRLVRRGYGVEDAPAAVVSGEMPASLNASATQHERWEAGRIAAVRLVPPLLGDAVRRRSAAMLDAAFEQFVPPLAVIAAVLGAVALLSAVFGLRIAFSVASIGLAGLLGYLGSGIVVLRPAPLSMLRAVAVAPIYVGWKLVRYSRSLMPARTRAWKRTSRDEVA